MNVALNKQLPCLDRKIPQRLCVRTHTGRGRREAVTVCYAPRLVHFLFPRDPHVAGLGKAESAHLCPQVLASFSGEEGGGEGGAL